MKTTIILSVAGLIAVPAWAADLADEVKTAVQQLADKPNYSWTTKVDPPPGQGGRGGGGGRNGQQGGQAGDQQAGRGRGGGGRGGFGGGFGGGSPPAGKTEKGGFTVLTFGTGENTQEAVVKGDKVAVKEDDEWKTAAELADSGDGGGGGGGGQGGFNRARFLARRAQQFKSPATDAQEVLGRVKELKKEGESYSGELTAEAIKQMFTFRGRGGQQGGGGGAGNFPPPDTSGLKGTAKFWVKDGVLSKYETHLEGKMLFGRDNREFEMKRTTTVEVKDIGSTKVEVPAEAKKKLRT